jgi:hypothetical protein
MTLAVTALEVRHAMEKSPYEDLPEKVLAAFADRTMLSASELAPLLDMDSGTLRGLVAEGLIAGRLKGIGKKKRHYGFTLADVAKYLRGTQNVEVDRKEGFEYLKAALADSGMNVTLRKPRRKSKIEIKALRRGE